MLLLYENDALVRKKLEEILLPYSLYFDVLDQAMHFEFEDEFCSDSSLALDVDSSSHFFNNILANG